MTIRTRAATETTVVREVNRTPAPVKAPAAKAPVVSKDTFANARAAPKVGTGSFGLPSLGSEPIVGPSKTPPVKMPGADRMDPQESGVGGGIGGKWDFGPKGASASGSAGVTVWGGGQSGGIGFKFGQGDRNGVGIARGTKGDVDVTTLGDVSGGISGMLNPKGSDQKGPGGPKMPSGSGNGIGSGGGHGSEAIGYGKSAGTSGSAVDLLGHYGFGGERPEGAVNKGAAGSELTGDSKQPAKEQEKVDTNDTRNDVDEPEDTSDDTDDERVAKNDGTPSDDKGKPDPNAMPNPDGDGRGGGPRGNVYNPNPDGDGRDPGAKPSTANAQSSGGPSITTSDGWGDGKGPAAKYENLARVAAKLR